MNTQYEKLNKGIKRSNFIFYVIIPSIFLLLFLISYLVDDWRIAKKELTPLIPKEELFNDTTYSVDPSYNGNFIVYFLQNNDLEGIDQDVFKLEGFCKPYEDIYKVVWKISLDRRPLKGLAFDPYDNSKNKSDFNLYGVNSPLLCGGVVHSLWG
jgi:hypothetical protein